MIDDIRWANLFSFLNASDLGMPLDVRHPFADLRLIEFLRRIPARPWLVDKTLLRVAMQGRSLRLMAFETKGPAHASPFVRTP